MNQLTEKQADVLAFCWNFYLQNDMLPPLHSIKAHFGWASNTAAGEMLEKLCAKGFIEKNVVGKYKFTKATRQVIEIC